MPATGPRQPGPQRAAIVTTLGDGLAHLLWLAVPVTHERPPSEIVLLDSRTTSGVCTALDLVKTMDRLKSDAAPTGQRIVESGQS